MRRAPNWSGPSGERAARYLRTLAGVRLQEIAGRGRGTIFEFARVFRDRERRRSAFAGIHHAGVVPDRCGLRGSSWPTPPWSSPMRHGRPEIGPVFVPRPDRRSHGRTGTAYRCRGIRAVCRHRPACDRQRRRGRSRSAGKQRQSRRCGLWPTTPGRIFSARSWSSTSNPIWGRGRLTFAVRISGSGGGAGAGQGVRSARGRTVRGLCLRRRIANGFGEVDGCGRAAPPLPPRDGPKRRNAMASAIRWMRISWPPSPNAGGERGRAWLRPVGDASERGGEDRPGGLDAAFGVEA